MSLSPELAALRDEALRVTCQSWAIQKRWKLAKDGAWLVGPCPECGGTDRFSISIQRDFFKCRKCDVQGSGVIDLVMKTEKLEFVPACELITGRKAADPVDEKRMAELRAKAEADARKREQDAAIFRERAREAGYRIWHSAKAVPIGGIVSAYLAEARGLRGGRIDFSAPGWAAGMHIRYIAAHPYWDEKGKHRLHVGPAMIAGIQYPDDSFAGAHQTWIDLDRPKAKLVLPPDEKGRQRSAKKVRGSWKGGAIRLVTPPNVRRIVMGEGIETTLTAYAHAWEPDTAYWAGVVKGNMADFFVPPDWCRELIYLTDEAEAIGDMEKGLRRAEAARPGLVGMLVEPVGDGRDLNELVMHRG